MWHTKFFCGGGGLSGCFEGICKPGDMCTSAGLPRRYQIPRRRGALNKGEVSVTQNHTFVYQITTFCVAGVFDKVVCQGERAHTLILTVGNWPKARQSPHWPLSVPEVHKLQETAQEGPNSRLFFFFLNGERSGKKPDTFPLTFNTNNILWSYSVTWFKTLLSSESHWILTEVLQLGRSGKLNPCERQKNKTKQLRFNKIKIFIERQI